MPEKYGQDAGCMNKDKWYTIRKKPASAKDNNYMGEKNNDGCFNRSEPFFQNLPAEIKTPDRPVVKTGGGGRDSRAGGGGAGETGLAFCKNGLMMA